LQFDRRKTATAVSLFLLFAMVVSLFALPATTAQGTEKMYPFINAVPNPVGVDQETLLHVGVKHPLTNTNEGWTGLSVTITRPDGVVETLSDIRTDSTGSTGRTYRPTMAGNYTLVTHFPQQTLPTTTTRPFITPAGTTMLAADSDPLTLVVQEEPLQYYPAAPLPTEYWTRPIDVQLRSWSAIAGNWLDANARNPQYVRGNDDAPETAHILWTKEQVNTGGLVGEMTGPVGAADESQARDIYGFEMGDAYEGKWNNRIIMGGKLYYNIYAGVEAYKEIVCVDLHTGEEIWSRVLLNNLTISRGQLMTWVTYDNQGIWDYLWATGNAASLSMLNFNYTALNVTASQLGTIWCAFNPVNGDFIYALYGIPSGTQVDGPNGEILIYNVDLTRGYMTMWNSTNIPSLYQSQQYPSQGWGQWKAPTGRIVNATGLAGCYDTSVPPKPLNVTYNGLNGYQWNVSIASVTPGTRAFWGSVRAIYPQKKIVGSIISATSVTHWGISLEPGKEGQTLFNKTETAPAAWSTGNLTMAYQSTSEDVFLYWAIQTTKYYAWNAKDGSYLWETPISEKYLNFYGWTEYGERPVIMAYGKLLSTGVSGTVYCYDLTDGSLSWTYDAVDPYTEVLWNNNWWQFALFVTDGKFYCGHTEHSANQPMPRSAPFLCLNVTTGEVIWRANGLFRQTLWGGMAIIGDSIIATQDTYDTRVYAIGKGPSATTVSAGPKVSVEGSSVLVEGMVTDISPGTQTYAKTARFPNGVPAVADENQSDWMLYVYKQFARPADAVGVEVVLSVLDPNNNCYEIGRATSDASGFYSCAFTPEVPGKYTIYASFAGSKAYYGSSAETAINVDSAPAATPAPTPTPAPMTDTYIMGFGIGMIIAIIVVGLLLFLLLRKR
jgi:outer membrane protein assembly factor BamB